MKIGNVIGRVVLSHKDKNVPNGRWLLVSPCGQSQLSNDAANTISKEPSLVVYDELGCTTGDRIGYSEGGEASKPFPKAVPIDAYNCCLLDKVEFFKDRKRS